MKELPPRAASDSLASRLLKRLPGGSFAQEQIDKVERRLLSELKHRLDGLQPQTSVSVMAVSVHAHAAPSRGGDGMLEPGKLLRDLLQVSMEQTREQAQAAFFGQILRNMLPDEARILSALSGDSTYPLINVMSTSLLGMGGKPMLECVSNVGKNAGALCPDLVPVYVQRLRSWGLVALDPENPSQNTQYEMLETDTAVRTMIDKIIRSGHKGQIQRRTLRMSDFGNALWAACRLSEDQ